MAKPTLLPEWALSIVVDPTSGKNNRTVPSSGERNTGFVPLNVKPKRQAMNWLFNTIHKWLEFFDGVVDQDVRAAASPTFVNLTTTGTLTSPAIQGPVTITGALIVSTLLTVSGKATLSAGFNSIAGSDTGITGAELETLSDGSNADSLHEHATFPNLTITGTLTSPAIQGPVTLTGALIVSTLLTVSGKATLSAGFNSIAGSDTGITGAELETLSDGSNADSLHRHEKYINLLRSGAEFKLVRLNASPTEIQFARLFNGVFIRNYNYVTTSGGIPQKHQIMQVSFVKEAFMSNISVHFTARVADKTSASNRFDVVAGDGLTPIGSPVTKLGTAFAANDSPEDTDELISLAGVTNGTVVDVSLGMGIDSATVNNQDTRITDILIKAIA